VKNFRADVATVPLPAAIRGTFGDYFTLMKPRLNLLVVATSAAGYYLGAGGSDIAVVPMVMAVGGTALVAAGAAVLNQAAEHRTDALMDRTRFRPIPDGRVTPTDARILGVALSGAGLAALAATAHLVAAALAVTTLLIYIGIYTPLKRRTPLATLIGAVPGALPPLIGWTASHGSVSPGGAALFAIVFFWQIPHFMAIAWMYRDDYRKAAFPMLSVLDATGRRAARQAVFYTLLLIAASTVPTLVGISGYTFLAVAVTTGAGLLLLAVRFAAVRTDESARFLFLGSIVYLPLLWMAMIANQL
jgi:protoheme IX farnesyltransferase